jgi:hypothetical protein
MSELTDNNAKGGYTHAEKIALVAHEAMDPKEIGMVDADEAKLVITGQKPPQVTGGTAIVFRASVIPLELRAHWAFTELLVRPLNPELWKAEWIEKNKNEPSRIQGEARIGTTGARFETDAKDAVLGMIGMLRKAADQIEEKYSSERSNAAGIAAMDPTEMAAALKTVGGKLKEATHAGLIGPRSGCSCSPIGEPGVPGPPGPIES